MKHCSRFSRSGPILPFNNPILLWGIQNYQLSPNSLLFIELIECIGGILTPIIQSQYLDLPPCSVLHKSFELLEPMQDLLRFLALQEVHPGLPGMVIDECHIILKTSQRNR